MSNVGVENHLHESVPKWFAVYTHYKREKIVVDFLKRKGIECYLPLNRVTRKWTRKVKQLEIPLINCYVFVRIVKNEYVKVLETENVLNFVSFSKNLISIPNEQIDLLKRITDDFSNIELLEEDISVGSEVEIVRGSLTGVKGRLVEKDTRKGFVIELEDLGCNFFIEVDSSLLIKI